MNENENNGFVMGEEPQDTTTSNTEYQESVNQPEYEEQPEVQVEPEVTPLEEQIPTMEPMPSQDNIYRFQNEAAVKKIKTKEKKGLTVPRIILFAVLFGVVAAGCFSIVTWGINALTGINDTTRNQSSIPPKRVEVLSDTSSVSGSGAVVTGVDVSRVVDNVMPCIVSITEKTLQTSSWGESYPTEGAGSGFIVKIEEEQLLIVTNNHVVAGADEIVVQFNDGEKVNATIKGTSESNDLAVITVDMKKVKDSTKAVIREATLGSSDEAKVGQMVIAIGNALGYGQSVTVGYVSAKDRQVTSESSDGSAGTTQTLMQTDAAINPGNSGGALIDTTGKVVGINSSKYFAYGNTTVEGMGYAIPISDAIPIINDLMNREVLKDNEKGYLGITGRNTEEAERETYGFPEGVYVQEVAEDGAADKAGIKKGDFIVSVNGTQVSTITEVQEIVNNTKAGTTIELGIKRAHDGGYKEIQIKVTLEDKKVLDGLEDSSEQPSAYEDYYDNYNGYQGGGNDYQIVPWGDSIY